MTRIVPGVVVLSNDSCHHFYLSSLTDACAAKIVIIVVRNLGILVERYSLQKTWIEISIITGPKSKKLIVSHPRDRFARLFSNPKLQGISLN